MSFKDKMKMSEQNVIQLQVPQGMKDMIEEIREVRRAKYEETTNRSIAKAAVLALYEKSVKGKKK